MKRAEAYLTADFTSNDSPWPIHGSAAECYPSSNIEKNEEAMELWD